MTPSEKTILLRLEYKSEVIWGGTKPGSDMSKLVDAGLVKNTALNLSDVSYAITASGTKALEEN
jgi:hypothetical protein